MIGETGFPSEYDNLDVVIDTRAVELRHMHELSSCE